MPFMDRARELANKYKWPAATGLGLMVASGGIGYARRRYQKAQEEAYLKGLIQGQMRGAQFPAMFGQMGQQKQAQLFQKQAFAISPLIGKAIGFGTARARAGLKWAGNKLNTGLQTAGTRLNQWGNAAGSYLRRNGWNYLGNKVEQGGAALGRGTNWLRNQGMEFRNAFNNARGI